ncbi:hypothetical protein Pla175_49450 [Pirellulimonas nuda]|uniref:DUF1501 domain-containing protein n=1 Tax=Pirellulimonas nuda TaxID=2528009 RepID=A0A518DJ92_9BACT|nr:DUF1501 domain-containing protein [Pirellulimonas nuda]QDU91516.1 hypothetical protein Pla175_49450 [Pirellulimonas nuda]
MQRFQTPRGMSRRHFMGHLAGASAWTLPAIAFTRSLQAAAPTLNRNHKSAILLWMSGGPPTIDIWDLKPGAPTGGPSRQIATAGDLQISSLMPEMAKQMGHYSVVRSMSTREADHSRGRYYLHTGYVPNPNIVHPSYGAVVAHELEPFTRDLEIPPFVSVGGASEGPGFLGMAYAPFQVDSNGRVRNLQMPVKEDRMAGRLAVLDTVEDRFIRQNRGSAAADHAQVLAKTRSLLTSDQMKAFNVMGEPQEMRDRYGDSGFGRGCLLARRLVEAGVPFVEVDFGGWDLHQNCFDRLDQKLPEMDKAMAALTADLESRGLLQDTVIIWMGEFGRTPNINGDAGRDHFARAWSAVVGGGGVRGGQAIGQTSADGSRVESEPFASEDLMASVCQALGISLQTTFTSNNGRPMKIAGGGKVIPELFA